MWTSNFKYYIYYFVTIVILASHKKDVGEMEAKFIDSQGQRKNLAIVNRCIVLSSS